METKEEKHNTRVRTPSLWCDSGGFLGMKIRLGVYRLASFSCHAFERTLKCHHVSIGQLLVRRFSVAVENEALEIACWFFRLCWLGLFTLRATWCAGVASLRGIFGIKGATIWFCCGRMFWQSLVHYFFC